LTKKGERMGGEDRDRINLKSFLTEQNKEHRDHPLETRGAGGVWGRGKVVLDRSKKRKY